MFLTLWKGFLYYIKNPWKCISILMKSQNKKKREYVNKIKHFLKLSK